MDLTFVVNTVGQFGALGILAIMVWRAPSVLAAINDLIQRVIANVREAQSEALNVFKSEQQNLIDMIDRRFSSTEGTLVKLVENQTTLLIEIKSLGLRVGSLEHSDKPK
jgi:hypothetical protein